jgi:hypothetical protein
VKKLSFSLLALAVILALLPAGIAQAKTPLRATTAYEFVAPLGIVDGEGRALIWQGTIAGDINGVIKWWAPPEDKVTGQALHYTLRMEVWSSDESLLLLAADQSGSTTVRHGKNSNWRETGVVTEASEEFAMWLGRRVYESGTFTWQVIDTPGGPLTIPEAGTSIFRIN